MESRTHGLRRYWKDAVSQRNFPAEQIDSLTEPEGKPEKTQITAFSVVIMEIPGGGGNTKFVDQCRERLLLFVDIHLLPCGAAAVQTAKLKYELKCSSGEYLTLRGRISMRI
jgi:hypothetical protein